MAATLIRCEYISWKGHGVEEWDPNKPGALEKMRNFFKEKLKAGFRAFAFKEGDEKPKRIKEFDEEAERVVLVSDKVFMFQPARGG